MSNVKRSMSIARDRPPEAMPKRRPDATETPAGAQVIGCKRSQYRERPAFPGYMSRDVVQRSAGGVAQVASGVGIAAVARGIHQGPQCPCGLCLGGLGTQEMSTNAEQQPSAQAQAFGYPHTPGERLKQWQPRILKPGQINAADAALNKLMLDCAEPRFARGRLSHVKFFKPLTPPGHPDRAQTRIRCGRHHIGECEIEVPERRDSRPDLGRRGFKGRQSVGVEPPLSDSRRLSPPRRLARP